MLAATSPTGYDAAFSDQGLEQPRPEAMSIHKSLATKGSLVRSRNVLTRYERILQLRKTGRWKEDEGTAFGLPKVRVLKVKKRGKEKKKKEDEAAAGVGYFDGPTDREDAPLCEVDVGARDRPDRARPRDRELRCPAPPRRGEVSERPCAFGEAVGGAVGYRARAAADGA